MDEDRQHSTPTRKASLTELLFEQIGEGSVQVAPFSLLNPVFRGYVRAYDSHSLKQIYDINTLDLVQVSKSFGFEVPPFVDLPVSHKPKVKSREKYGGAGYKKHSVGGNKQFFSVKKGKPTKIGS